MTKPRPQTPAGGTPSNLAGVMGARPPPSRGRRDLPPIEWSKPEYCTLLTERYSVLFLLFNSLYILARDARRGSDGCGIVGRQA